MMRVFDKLALPSQVTQKVLGGVATGVLAATIAGCAASSGDSASNKAACEGTMKSLTRISAAISANPQTGVDESTRIANGTAISQETLTVIDEVKGFQESATDSSVKDGIEAVVSYLMMFGVWVLTPSQPQPDSSMLSEFSSACQPFTGAPSTG